MAAAAFTGTLIFRGTNGKSIQMRCTMSDVAAAAWVFQDGSTTLQLPTGATWSLVDALLVTGGTDTTNSSLFVNQQAVGFVLDHKSNLTTVQFRQLISNPISFAGGSQLKFVQAA